MYVYMFSQTFLPSIMNILELNQIIPYMTSEKEKNLRIKSLKSDSETISVDPGRIQNTESLKKIENRLPKQIMQNLSFYIFNKPTTY